MENIADLKASYGKLYDEELKLEAYYKEEAQDSLRTMLQKAEENGSTSQVPIGSKLVSYGFEDSLLAVTAWYEDTIAPRRGVQPGHKQLLKEILQAYSFVDAEGTLVERKEDMLNMLTLIPLMCLMDSIHAKNGQDLNYIVQLTFEGIYAETRVEAFIKTIPANVLKGLEAGISTRGDRRYKEAYARNVMTKQGFDYPEWNTQAKFLLGYHLIEVVVKGSGFFSIVSTDGETGADILSSVQPTEWLLRAWELNSSKMLDSTTRTCPMVIPPQKWEGIEGGGYYGCLAGEHSLIRYRRVADKQLQANYKKKLKQADLTDLLESINTIQETPWRINRAVLRVLEAIFKAGGGRAGIPLTDRLPQLPDLTEPFTAEELKEHKRKKYEIYKEDVARASQANRYAIHLRTAKRYSKYQRIYFPYSMDFRGRVYPISTFSPQSDDINKGLLEFADVPVVKDMEAIEWLMVHGANCAGVDKVSFAARKQWILDNEQNILDTATDPLSNRFWEIQDDSSFQFLAFCFEWKKWKEYEKEHNGNPEGFISRIPLAFDGTCSGLQHYSAILRDSVGGSAVNLVPDTKPHDIYKVVAEKVMVLLKKDSMEGTESEEVEYEEGVKGTKLGTLHMARVWLMRDGGKGVTRSVTKRCVMTLAYGSREYGFKGQIIDSTINDDIKAGHLEMKDHKNQYAAYLAKYIWQAVQSTVVAAVEGMTYLQEIAKIASKSGHPISWTTPIGLPLMQSYNIIEMSRIYLRLHGGIRRWAYIPQGTPEVDTRKQRTGIAPNFIHSMDACHLQMTVLHCRRAYNIKHFALIHDSYGTPASQASDLFKGVREAFHKMYTENDVMKAFKAELSIVMEDSEGLPDEPEKGILNIDDVLKSLYMFA